LRPDGEKGLLINSLAACRNYYHSRAQLWEIQALTRARFVAGDEALGRKFCEMAGELTDFRKPPVSRPPITHYESPTTSRLPDFPGWKQSIHQMRQRIEKERSPAGADQLALKTGAGGLMDAEFIAQAACLETGLREPNTVRALEAARASAWMPADQAGALLENYARLRRVESILRRWSFQGETVLPSEEPPLRRVALRCGYAEPGDLIKDVTCWRASIRAVYNSVFTSQTSFQEG
jgi:glutamate-ammonia-ligase adenylyltransferase